MSGSQKLQRQGSAASVDDAIQSKAWDEDGVPVADSNCADIGSAADKEARKAAACTEKAWEGCGQEAGVDVWRIEQFKVVPYPKVSYGNWYSGDSYIVLQTAKDPSSGKLTRAIFFWLGEKTTTDEMGTAAYKTVELDSYFDGQPTQHREVMNHESTQFKKLFTHMQYLEGGVETGFHHVATGTYKSKLLQVRRTNVDGVRVQEVTLSRDSMNHGDCFILDMGAKIYCWAGDDAAAVEKAAANQAAEGIEAKRLGKAQATWDLDDAFWAELGGEGPINPASEGTDAIAEPNHGEGVLYVITDGLGGSGGLQTKEVAHGNLNSSMLETDNVMMLDTNAEIFLWVGSGASAGESTNALATAMAYLKLNNRPNHTPMHILKEGSTIINATWNKIMESVETSPQDARAVQIDAPGGDVSPRGDGSAGGQGGGDRYGGLSLNPQARPSTVVKDRAPRNSDEFKDEDHGLDHEDRHELWRPGTATIKPTEDSDAAAGVMTLDELKDRKVWSLRGVEPSTRELHLSDEEFQATFGMAKDAWGAVPKWKKESEKKKIGLF